MFDFKIGDCYLTQNQSIVELIAFFFNEEEAEQHIIFKIVSGGFGHKKKDSEYLANSIGLAYAGIWDQLAMSILCQIESQYKVPMKKKVTFRSRKEVSLASMYQFGDENE